MSSSLLDKGYEPQNVERRWYAFWEKEHLFAAREEGAEATYSIVIPPPNVTGALHMGHALNITMQDVLCRYRRLKGDNVLWMPGTDHAGIATQNVVEKKLAGEGKDRRQLGREKFIEAVWEWRNAYGSAIINQLKRLGASCDWKRERFTMDDGLSQAVRKVFVQLYEEGLIYRGDYIINWCHRCHTALSDLEVEHEEHDARLYHIRYPYVDGSGGVVVATTRPETLFGDTAVAVNPDDERYQELQKTRVLLPLTNRTIPIIKDAYVEMGFGTGALKITPAHDPNDFEIGARHGLPSLKVIDDNGVMTAWAGKYQGLDRFECRKAAVQDLKKEGLLQKVEPYRHSVGHCYRCKTVVEPNLSRQWFVSIKPLAEKAVASVEDGRTRIIPATWNATFFDWMNNIKDWCISRQIWWGHQIPAWTCQACDKEIVAMEAPKSCPKCGSESLVQETDVLDTWFSSALWPFSTMGWPEQTPLLKKFYPTSVLITGFDILFFWVARMMMMGIHFMGDVPFKDVYVHALIRDEEGQKMSKSKGNVIDPLDVIDRYGTDAFRFTLAAFAAQGRDIRMSEKRIEGYRHFINKLWNAARFSLIHLEKGPREFDPDNLALIDRWILSRLAGVARTVSEELDAYRYNEAASALYQFVWHEFCDWHLEAVKPTLYGNSGDARQETAKAVLWWVLKDALILLHPFIPFVTEEIWHKLPGTAGSIMTARFPAGSPDAEAESKMALISEIVSAIRNVRGEMNISPSLALDAMVHAEDDAVLQTLADERNMIITLARLTSLSVARTGKRPEASATAIVKGATLFIPLKGFIDFEKDALRLQKEIDKLDRELTQISRKLENENFLSKAPVEVVKEVRAKHRACSEKRDKLLSTRDQLERLGSE